VEAEPIRVRSSDPHADVSRAGLEMVMSRPALDAQNEALRERFVTLQRDGHGSATLAEHEARAVRTLAEVDWIYKRIAADLTALATATDGLERRDQIMHGILDELTAVTELSLGRSFARSTWEETLIALRRHIEQLIVGATNTAPALVDLDLALERFEHLERSTSAALRSYEGYISA
jgi:hypothetical protein